MNKQELEQAIARTAEKITIRMAYCDLINSAQNRMLLRNLEKELRRLQSLLKKCEHG
jgi:hypothetical protein